MICRTFLIFLEVNCIKQKGKENGIQKENWEGSDNSFWNNGIQKSSLLHI
jgi:hypothetical protein